MRLLVLAAAGDVFVIEDRRLDAPGLPIHEVLDFPAMSLAEEVVLLEPGDGIHRSCGSETPTQLSGRGFQDLRPLPLFLVVIDDQEDGQGDEEGKKPDRENY